MDRLLHDPSQQLRVKREHDEDEQALARLMELMPEVFLYEYDGVQGSLVRVKFRPKSNYSPSTYEGLLTHSLAGTILIDLQRKRLAKFSGQLINRVQFEYGFLGHSTMAAQLRLDVYRSDLHNGTLP